MENGGWRRGTIKKRFTNHGFIDSPDGEGEKTFFAHIRHRVVPELFEGGIRLIRRHLKEFPETGTEVVFWPMPSTYRGHSCEEATPWMLEAEVAEVVSVVMRRQPILHFAAAVMPGSDCDEQPQLPKDIFAWLSGVPLLSPDLSNNSRQHRRNNGDHLGYRRNHCRHGGKRR